LTFFFSMKLVGSKFFTSPAILELYSDASNRVIGAMPGWPRTIESHDSAVPIPLGVTSPIPVMTTRSLKGGLL
jgi:hypothetical protein